MRRRAALAALASLLHRPISAEAAAIEPFDFVALGDMPYGPDLIQGQAYRQLIDQINALGLPLTIHVGDFKSGIAPCSDAEYTLQQQYFQRFAQALVYTPGDNDWLDCQRLGDAPLERLQALRQRFFTSRQSLGLRPIPVERQADLSPAFGRYVENLRWTQGPPSQGLVFATFHSVGPNNAVDDGHADVRAEARVREAANAAWIAEAFALARHRGARALVLATQAETLVYPDRSGPRRGVVREGFARSVEQTLLPLADAAPFPVLLIHGDGHQHIVDRPFRNARGEPIAKLWRMEVFGDSRMHAVRVRVNPPPDPHRPLDKAEPPFAFTPIRNLMSPDPSMPSRIEA
jgi:hypothetical protein